MLGEKLIELRKEKDVRQEDVADYLNIARPTYTQYETNKRRPDLDTLYKLADYFGVSTDYILGRTDQRNQVLQKQVIDDPIMDDLLKRVPDLSDEEKESLAEHLEFALKQIEKERQRRSKENQ